MEKYSPLEKHLNSIQFDNWRVSFVELEKILGFNLPASARKYAGWWSNQKTGSRAHHWIAAGYITSELDLENEKVTFAKGNPKFQHSETRKKSNPSTVMDEPTNLSFSWDIAEKLEATLGLQWHPVGKIMQLENKLVFPSVSKSSGLYRIRIRNKGEEDRYIGESVNLRRRFSNYRNPGSTQKTSIRINNYLLKSLDAGAEINLATITENAWINLREKTVKCDLSDKATRVMLEHFAQVLGSSMAINSLNK